MSIGDIQMRQGYSKIGINRLCLLGNGFILCSLIKHFKMNSRTTNYESVYNKIWGTEDSRKAKISVGKLGWSQTYFNFK